eukprot:6198060-Pleurochrysis_carterae.AAC.3
MALVFVARPAEEAIAIADLLGDQKGRNLTEMLARGLALRPASTPPASDTQTLTDRDGASACAGANSESEIFLEMMRECTALRTPTPELCTRRAKRPALPQPRPPLRWGAAHKGSGLITELSLSMQVAANITHSTSHMVKWAKTEALDEGCGVR